MLEKDDELYILAKSTGRVHKEQVMRQRKLKRLWKRLHELQNQTLSHNQLLLKLGAAKKEAGKAYSLVEIKYPTYDEDLKVNGFQFSLRIDRLRQTCRSNIAQQDPAQLWNYYIQLTEVEQAF